MSATLAEELAALGQLSVGALRARYAQAFGEETHVGNKAWLVKRIAWRLQALAEGDLSERARQRAMELAKDADLRLLPPRVRLASPPTKSPADSAPPAPPAGERSNVAPGTVITRVYKGRTLEVHVLPEGFSFEGRWFKSLSAAAKAISGQHCSGNFFFRIGKESV